MRIFERTYETLKKKFRTVVFISFKYKLDRPDKKIRFNFIMRKPYCKKSCNTLFLTSSKILGLINLDEYLYSIAIANIVKYIS